MHAVKANVAKNVLGLTEQNTSEELRIYLT